jgi:hypothetical protein
MDLTEPILNDHLEENLVDDPYGTAMYSIRNILHRAIAHAGAMNDAEYRNLLAIEEAVRARVNE